MFPNILVTTTREWVELLWRTTFFSGNHLLHSVVLQWSFNSPSLVHTHEPPLLPLTMLIMSITCCQVCRHLWSARNTLRGWNLQVGEVWGWNLWWVKKEYFKVVLLFHAVMRFSRLVGCWHGDDFTFLISDWAWHFPKTILINRPRWHLLTSQFPFYLFSHFYIQPAWVSLKIHQQISSLVSKTKMCLFISSSSSSSSQSLLSKWS